MEYLAYSYIYIADEQTDENFVLDIPKLSFNAALNVITLPKSFNLILSTNIL